MYTQLHNKLTTNKTDYIYILYTYVSKWQKKWAVQKYNMSGLKTVNMQCSSWYSKSVNMSVISNIHTVPTSLVTHWRARSQWTRMTSCTFLCCRESAVVYSSAVWSVWHREGVCHCPWSSQFCPPPAFPAQPPGCLVYSLEQSQLINNKVN